MLPDLALSSPQIPQQLLSENKIQALTNSLMQDPNLITKRDYKPLNANQLKTNDNNDTKVIKQLVNSEDETGFFKDMMTNITNDISNIEKLDNWFESQFKNKDIVGQMRDYWEKQKPELALKTLNNELVESLKLKVEKLHQLEKEWQDIFMSLHEKEEQMRQEEKELKESMSQLIDECRKKLGKK